MANSNTNMLHNSSKKLNSKYNKNLDSTSTVKECLQYQLLTPFQTLVSELRNTVMKSYWNKEVGKTHYLVPYLPIGLDPLKTTFGKKFKSEATMADLINPPEIDKKSIMRTDDSFCRFEEVSQEDEGTQITRNYNCHFNKHTNFGKRNNADVRGSRIKKIIRGGDYSSTTLVNYIQADFLKETQLLLGQIKNPKKCLSSSTIYGKPSAKEIDSVADALQESPIDKTLLFKWEYLQYLRSLRNNLKKRNPSIDYFDIYEDLVSLDKEHTGILSEEDVFTILGNYNIHPERQLFNSLLDLLELRQNEKLFYNDVVDLLNWKRPFPTLPIAKSKSKEDISPLHEDDDKSCVIPPKYYPCNEKLYPRKFDNVYALIFPNTFTKFGLNHIDFFKLRSKKEIQSIFENIGITFPDNTFDILWEKAIKKDGAEGVCVDTFNGLLDESIDCSQKNI
ncbi:EF-hand domain-containing family member B [Vespula squamosa]|uniref:EF-hand domain-containing family member B n=1 Tax=Vespula squamosa TaxID=30214 RepID=A0ABD2ADD3_VESSQ